MPSLRLGNFGESERAVVVVVVVVRHMTPPPFHTHLRISGISEDTLVCPGDEADREARLTNTY